MLINSIDKTVLPDNLGEQGPGPPVALEHAPDIEVDVHHVAAVSLLQPGEHLQYL